MTTAHHNIMIIIVAHKIQHHHRIFVTRTLEWYLFYSRQHVTPMYEPFALRKHCVSSSPANRSGAAGLVFFVRGITTCEYKGWRIPDHPQDS